MTNETSEEAFRRLCGEMGVGESWRMTRAEINNLGDEWFARMGYTRAQAAQLAAVRECIDAADARQAETKSRPVHPAWQASNARLLARRANKEDETKCKPDTHPVWKAANERMFAQYASKGGNHAEL